MAAPLPHLQFAVLCVLAGESISGREVRSRLASLDLEKSGPAFYRLMARLEEAKLVSGWYEQEVIDRQIVRERFYQATAAGRRARNQTARHHRRIIAQFDGSHA